jgi:hypothetical protein
VDTHKHDPDAASEHRPRVAASQQHSWRREGQWRRRHGQCRREAVAAFLLAKRKSGGRGVLDGIRHQASGFRVQGIAITIPGRRCSRVADRGSGLWIKEAVSAVHVLTYGGGMYCRLMDMDNVEVGVVVGFAKACIRAPRRPTLIRQRLAPGGSFDGRCWSTCVYTWVHW